jgi:hypothetical protein
VPVIVGAPSAAVVNGLIYVIGGYSPSGGTLYTPSPNQVYDPSSNSWSVRSSPPTARSFATAQAINDKIYLIGGHSSQLYAVNEQYDPATDKWLTMTPMLTPRAGMSSVVVGGEIFVLGGGNMAGVATGVNEVYDPIQNSWSTAASMPTPRSEFGAAQVNNQINTVGGIAGGMYVSTNEEYDSSSDTWITRASIPVTMGGNTAAEVNGLVFAIGINRNLHTGVSANYAYTPTPPAGPPIANDQSVDIPENMATSLTLTGSDTNTPPLPLTFAVTADPANGVLYGAAPNLTYTPNLGYTGQDSFQFTVNNGYLTSSPATVSITVGPLGTPTLTWNYPVSITYGSPLTAIQLDASAIVTGSFVYDPDQGTVLDAGTNALSVVFTPNNTNDYSSVTNTVSLVVSRAPLTVTVGNTNRPYGATNPPFNGTIAVLVNGDDISATYSCSATNKSPVGTYSIVASLVDPDYRQINYKVSLLNGSLVVTPAPLTVTAANASRPFGATNPVFSGVITGLRNADNILATYNTTAATNSPIGKYPIVPQLVDPDNLATNYSVILVNGTLTVTSSLVIQTVQRSGGSLTFTWSANTNQIYQIQSTASLTPPNWTNLGGTLVATNSTMSTSEPIGTNSQGFYRVALLPVASNLVTNGGFETGDFTGWSESGPYTYVESNVAQFHGAINQPPLLAHSGNYYVAFGAASDSTISQTISDQPGGDYSLSYWVFGGGNGTPSDVHVYWNGQLVSSINPVPAQPYTQYTVQVVGTGLDILEFGLADEPYWSALDDISLVPIP